MTVSDLNAAILKKAGFRVEQTTSKTVAGRNTYGATFTGEGQIPLVGRLSGEVSDLQQDERAETKDSQPLENHVSVDRRHKLIRRYEVTDAAVHDSRVLEAVLDADNTASDVWADSAYRSAEAEEKLAGRGLRSRIHRRAHRNRPLSQREQQGNRTRSKVRARVEHVFGALANDMGGTLVRSIGIVRARARIGLKNLAYNMRRMVQLDALDAARAPA